MGSVLNRDASLICCAMFARLVLFAEDACSGFRLRLGAMILGKVRY